MGTSTAAPGRGVLRPATPTMPPVYTVRTLEIQTRVLDALRAGCPRRFAAGAAGIGREALRVWINEDEEMAQLVEEAESLVVMRNLTLIERAGKADTRNWTALAWMLERTHPEEFG